MAVQSKKKKQYFKSNTGISSFLKSPVGNNQLFLLILLGCSFACKPVKQAISIYKFLMVQCIGSKQSHCFWNTFSHKMAS